MENSNAVLKKDNLFNGNDVKLFERMTNNMVKKNEHTNVGIASIIVGTLGLILYFIGLFFYSFVGNRLYGMVFGIIFGIMAIILGYLAKKQGDNYGTIGISIGVLILIIGIITFLLTNPVYVETSYSI